ncbi:ATP-dependent helicase/nuclease subunit A [uncultured bacterium]|nr:ATP-dependent helicase/nuclease subunit A [uncultured bacterium]
MKTLIDMTDDIARERALDPSASFVVQAPAGSGKTELLMQRYLKLLALVERPEQILALTFTRKAAGEMRSRILAAMSRAKEGRAPSAAHEAKTFALAARVLERDAAMGWSLLENPGRLKVQTIDSFSASVVRQTPVLSGLSRYTVTDEPEEFYREAAARTVALVEEDGPAGEALRKALGHLGNSVKGLMDRLVVMLERRDQWLRHLRHEASGPELRFILEGSLQRLIGHELETIARAFPPGIPGVIAPYARYAASNIEDQDNPIKRLSECAGLPSCDSSALPEWHCLRKLLLTDKNTLRKKVDVRDGFPAGKGDAADRKREFTDLLSSFEKFDCMVESLGRVSRLPAPNFTDEEWEALEAIISLLPIAETNLAEAFAEKGSVDFQGVSLAALKALGTEDDPTDLMLSLDLRVQHILVDEFQDTSGTQMSLLETLTKGWTEGDGRTLFVVGDPMQSIYLFREAEVGLFLDARMGRIGTVRMEPLTLSRNFRSLEGVVSWVNKTMESAFAQSEDAFTGAVVYSPSVSVKGHVEGSGVDMTLFSARDDGAEAQKALSILKGIPEGETTAILCRSRGHLHSIVEALKKEGMQFGAQAIDPLAERTAVRDLMALLRALSHPLDRVAWLACLRAPWTALSLSDLHALCLGDRQGPVRALLGDGERLARLSADGRARAARFAKEFGKALEIWGRRQPSEALRGLWISLGGPACCDEEGREDAARFLSLIEEVESSGAVSVREIDCRMKGLYADHASAGKKLDIMTIHKAKGLEFDNVIIPGMGKRARSDDKRLLVWMERGEEDLLLAPIESKGSVEGSRIYSYLSAIKKEKTANEEIRLLYVAATRAKKNLFLLGHVGMDEDGGIKAAPRSFLSRIPHALSEDMVTGAEAPEEAREKPVLRLKRLPITWELPKAMDALPSAGSFVQPSSDDGPRFYWAGEAVKHLGTAVHRYFCRIAKEGVDKWDLERLKGEEPRMRSMLKALGLSGAEAARASAEGVSILKKALDDEKGRWALSAHCEASSELPLTAVVRGEIIRVVIDRTFVDPEGVRWVIDFKTGTHAGGSLEEFLESERGRYRGQLQRYEEALRAYGETRPIRKGLYYPAHRAWVEVEG